jgi:signal transduction histidine kinase
MKSASHVLRSFRPGDHRLSQEAGGSMFARLRRHLTFWYSAVLAGMLLLSGIILYFAVYHSLMDPVQSTLVSNANHLRDYWELHPGEPYGGESPPRGGGPTFSNGQAFLTACYNQYGDYIINLYTSNAPGDPDGVNSSFVANSLASQAVANGSATGTIDGGSEYGTVYVYAEVVPDPTGTGILGVVQVGELVTTQLDTLNNLLVLLLILGAATLFAAAVGGLLLAERALAPARLAFARQQAFIADASHELRTPLTLMRADAEVLLSGRARLDPDDTALLEDIVAEAGHMGALADHMLALARLDAGQVHLEREVVDLADVATRAAHRAHAFAQEKQVTLHVEPTDPALVIADKSLLEQATMILVDNAIKYNRSGGSVTLHASSSQGQACLEISDTGIGIATEHLPHLGERFYRVDKARSREAGGAGLGLSIARGIAASHGGTLTLSSIAGQGTTARILLPPADGASHQSREEI